MPSLDPQLNQIIWWIVLGAFIGWLLWVLIDRLVWRDGASAAAIDQEQHAGVVAELGSARREENLLRAELVREQEETQRLVGITKDLRDKLNGQEQIVANLEAALDAARYSSPGTGAAVAQAAQLTPETSLPNTSPKPPSDEQADESSQRNEARRIADSNDPQDGSSSADGEQALRDLLAESDFTEDLDELLGADEDLFGAPTEILATRGKLSDKQRDPSSDPFAGSTQIRYTKPARPVTESADDLAQNGPMTDAELDRLLNLDTGKLFAEGIGPDQAEPADSNPDGHTLTMLDRLRDEQEPDRRAIDPPDRTERNSSLISRLRGAFSRRPGDGER